MDKSVVIIGAGLAGCEAALWLAEHGVHVFLYEQKPLTFSPAHTSEGLAELVCSNSFKAERFDSAGGLLKNEMRIMGSYLLPVADSCKVPAGGALAVDRNIFSQKVTQLVEEHANIHLIHKEITQLPENTPTLIASGPLTQGKLADVIGQICGEKELFFYDAAAPIVTASSLDTAKVFEANRYGKGTPDYINCPFNKEEYEAFYEALVEARGAPLHSFDKNLRVYEGCMPIEVMAKRGTETLRYGPLRPVGLVNPATGHRPWANVQLRQENTQASLYNIVGFQTNLKFGEQKRVFSMIPGLEQAEFARYGVMHRNTFLNSPQVLKNNFSLNTQPSIFFAGQIVGFEGYMESAACGLLAARAIFCLLNGKLFVPPSPFTMCGALTHYIVLPNANFQPMGANMGILPPLDVVERDKRKRYGLLAQRAQIQMQNWASSML